MRNVLLLGAAALISGIIFGIMTLAPPPAPAQTAPIRISPTSVPLVRTPSAFLVQTLPTAPPTDTVEPLTVVEDTVTPIPPTPEPSTPSPSHDPPTKSGSDAAPVVNAWSVVVLDENSGAVLYSRDPHRRLPPASLTKIFTALVALSHGDLHSEVKVQFDSTELIDSTMMGIHSGETYTLEDLLYGLMLPSGNDSALAIANALAGSEAGFADMMNAQATDLGLTDSHFVNVHGLDATGHYSSAYDLAMAARYGMTHEPEYPLLARAKSWEVHGTKTFPVTNLNRFLLNYSGADGVKIGYTDNAGKGIVASATRNGHRVYVALLHAGDIVNDSTPLFNWVFANYTWPAN